TIRRQDCRWVEYVRPTGSDVKGVDECSLVLPDSLLVELVWLLKPGTRIIHVHVNAVLRARLKIYAIKNVFRVSFCVKDGKFRRIEEASGLQAACRYEIPPVLAPHPQIEVSSRCPKGAVGGSDTAGRLQVEAGTCCHIDDQSRLIAVLSRRNSIDGLKRLHC